MSLKASKQTNNETHMIAFIAKFQLKIWSMFYGITEKFKLEITFSPSKILVKGRLVSCTDLKHTLPEEGNLVLSNLKIYQFYG